jgi:hypothetical protein
VVSFDYWLGPGKNRLYVQMWNRDKSQNYGIGFPDPVRGRWAHAVVRMRDGAGLRDAKRLVGEGDRFSSLTILGGRMAGDALYLDNVKLEDVSPETLPPASNVRLPVP